MRNVMALILSGGGGERLGVLSAERAVSALPFGGKYRVIDFSLEQLPTPASASACSRARAGLAQRPHRRRPPVGSRPPPGRVVILQPYQTRSHAGWYRGTARRDHAELELPSRSAVPSVLVLSGDRHRMDYRALFLAHEQRSAAVTLAVTRVPSDQTQRFGMVTTDRGGRVRTLEGSPSAAPRRNASMGIYVFEFKCSAKCCARARWTSLTRRAASARGRGRAAYTRTSSTVSGKTSARSRRTTARAWSRAARAALPAARRALADPDARRRASRGDRLRQRADRGQPDRERLPHRRHRAALDSFFPGVSVGRGPRSRTPWSWRTP